MIETESIKREARRPAKRPQKDTAAFDRHFEFISVQSPDDAKDREKRRQARSHALKESLRSKRLRHSKQGNDITWKIWQIDQTDLDHSSPEKRSQDSLAPLYSPSANMPDPFGTLAIDSLRLKQLLHQSASRKAIEPVFTIEDGALFQTFRSVFRTGLDDPALLNAVMLAFAFQAKGGIIDEECLYYKGQAIHFIREHMTSPIQGPTEPILGAILLVAGVEARQGMRSQVQVHMKGIQQLLQASSSARVHLTDGIKRAIFWQDLNASLMTGSERVVDHTTFAELGWRRDPFSPFMFELPRGFQSLVHLFTNEFIEIMQDINALQIIRNSPSFVYDDLIALVHIDNHQAWIKSRLWGLPKGSSFQECCRYAAYLSANLLCCKVWRTSAIPSYLSSQILHNLKKIIDSSQWDEHPDLLLWLLYMGGSVARDRMVRSEYVVLLQSDAVARCGGQKISWPDLVQTMEQFVWSEDGLEPAVREFWEETQLTLC